MHTVVTTLLWGLAIGCGLMAGVYFAFSAFVMRALAEAGQASGVAAINAINRVILRTLFMPLFFGTTIGAVLLPVMFPTPAAMAAAVVYVLGMFGVTMVFNVPLNNALMAAAPDDAAAAPVWVRYVRVWTRWNHVRTTASTTACALYVYDLCVMF